MPEKTQENAVIACLFETSERRKWQNSVTFEGLGMAERRSQERCNLLIISRLSRY